MHALVFEIICAQFAGLNGYKSTNILNLKSMYYMERKHLTSEQPSSTGPYGIRYPSPYYKLLVTVVDIFSKCMMHPIHTVPCYFLLQPTVTY